LARDSDRNTGEGDDSAPTVMAGTQRLDKWLWFARVVKTRTLAAALVTDGRVRLNRNRIEKPAQAVRPGDVLTIGLHGRVRILEVVAPGVNRGGVAEAALLFKDLSPPPAPRAEAPPPAGGVREPGSGRPTKRERRATDLLHGRDE
jgi:ribosome-associated heat shock protein Hsp15